MKDIVDIVTQIIELGQKYGVQPLYIVIIIFLTWGIKKYDNRRRIKKNIVFLPVIIGLFVCFLGEYTKNTVLSVPWVFNWIMISLGHAAVSALGYDVWSSYRKEHEAKKGS